MKKNISSVIRVLLLPFRVWGLLVFAPLAVLAQKDSVLSGVYKWNEAAISKQNKIASTILLEGKVHDFEWMQLTANSLNPSPARIKQTVPKNQEQLIIIKAGVLQIGIGDSAFSLNAGSVAVLMPGENFFSFTALSPVVFIP